MMKRGKRIFGILASILECPSPGITEDINRAMQVLETVSWEAKLHLERFLAFCRANPISSLREVYKQTFDCKTHCCPYLGHHLFDHDRSRTLFAEKLKEQYLPHHVARNEQTPDHIAVVLRSLVVQDSVEEARDLITCCLVPASKKMLAALAEDNVYQEVLRAVLLTLEAEERLAGNRSYQFAGAR